MAGYYYSKASVLHEMNLHGYVPKHESNELDKMHVAFWSQNIQSFSNFLDRSKADYVDDEREVIIGQEG